MRARSTAGTAPDTVDGVDLERVSIGSALDSHSGEFFEPGLRSDLSEVSNHSDARAERAAVALSAHHFAIRRDIALARDHSRPGENSAGRPIAHELAPQVRQRNDFAVVARQDDPDGGVSNPISDAGESLPGGVTQQPPQAEALPTPAPDRLCGPDVTSAITAMLGSVEPWFTALTGFQQSRSCAALGPGAFLVGVNPIMAWDTRELFLPNTDWLDTYFLSHSCGSPRDSGCESDPTRHLCETSGTCGNSVVVDGKCLLAGTANYALFGKMCKICHDHTGSWNRWDMRATIGAYKTISGDDSTPPKEVATAAYDGTFPALPGAAANRASCTSRCGQTHGGSFDFIWEPYRPR